MSAFDSYIESVHGFARALEERGCPSTLFDRPGDALRENLPMRVGPGANPGIILRGDTFLELGNPTAGSCACLLWSDDLSLVRDGRVRLFGPDIPLSEGKSLPFAQVLLLAGQRLGAGDHERLQQLPIVGDQIEGYMVRSAAQNVWSRVSREAAARGFDFRVLGSALLSLAREGHARVDAAEILFVTSSKEDVKELAARTEGAKAVASEMLRETWKARGYDLDCDFDCGSCHDSEVCDDIRDLIGDIKRKQREKGTGKR